MKTYEMKGTTDTDYTVLAHTKHGALGYREYDEGQFRVRVVPLDMGEKGAAMLSEEEGWKQPDHDDVRTIRYSKCTGIAGLSQVVGVALKAIESRAKNIFAS